MTSADLVSPSMPSHGITRYAAVPAEDGSYLVETEIPMQGDWVLYVNLDDGGDSAEFPFEVDLFPES